MTTQRAARIETLLWTAQRATAAVLAVCVAVHLATIIYAVRGGLTAAEILARTRGSLGWMLFYSLFVLAIAIHAPIGLRTIVREMTIWRGPSLDAVTALTTVLLLVIGWRAVGGLVG
ncbi:MAG TPA: succinate dehydrogenase [Alphaproteobacteria bacterium]|nr:succinate dehydrogenase [Alphaproteobacteria bacterium]